jgi:hypothetical protein
MASRDLTKAVSEEDNQAGPFLDRWTSGHLGRHWGHEDEYGWKKTQSNVVNGITTRCLGVYSVLVEDSLLCFLSGSLAQNGLSSSVVFPVTA